MIYECEHDYKYSHQERIPTQSTTAGTLEDVLDVVVCKKCGDVKRFEMKYTRIYSTNTPKE